MAKFNPADHLMKLKGKDYLEVKWRLVWLREEHPDAIVTTEHIDLQDNRAVFRATISLPNGGGATGYGSETQKDFGDFLEKAETKAVGRALAALGYGTQFAPELEEGERVVDSPVQRPNAPQTASKPPAKPTPINANGDKPITPAAMKRIHALMSEIGLDHQHLTAYAIDQGHKSSKDLTMEQVTKLGNGIKEKPEAVAKYLTDLLNKIELQQAGMEVGQQFDAMKAGQ